MTVVAPDRIRVLQVIGGTECGGSETWLTNVLKRCDRRQCAMDFLVHTNRPGHYDDLIRSHGAKILPCLSAHRPWRYARNLRQLLNRAGPYDVVHSHVWYFSGLVLRIANQQGVPVRIAHSHTVETSSLSRANLARRVYVSTMKRWIARHATHRLATSHAAVTNLGNTDRQCEAWKVLHCGVDLEPFQSHYDDAVVRRELGIPDDSYVIGHVGRFTSVKNHRHLLRTLAALVERDRSFFLLLVGDGPERTAIQQDAEQLGITNHVVLAGVRADVAKIMTCAMDAFVFPSFYEGLGLALVEAQAAGLPCVASTAVPSEATLVPRLVRRLCLANGPEVWADEIQKIRGEPVSVSREDALRNVSSSDFCISTSAGRLQEMYVEALAFGHLLPGGRGRSDSWLERKRGSGLNCRNGPSGAAHN